MEIRSLLRIFIITFIAIIIARIKSIPDKVVLEITVFKLEVLKIPITISKKYALFIIKESIVVLFSIN